MTTIKFTAVEFSTADEAFQHYYASGHGDRVIALGAMYYVTTTAEADRLAAAGVEFAHLFLHQIPDGTDRILSVPVN